METKGLYPSSPTEPQPQPQPILPFPPQIVQMSLAVGPEPILTVCPSCKAEIRTKVTHNATTKTHLMCCLFCCFLCWPCACLPYCMDSCRNTNHYCPCCEAFIGTYQS